MMIGTWDPADPQIPHLLSAEQRQTSNLRDEGFVEQLLLRADGAGGYMTLNAESEAAARARLDTLPFMQHEVMRIELVELTE